MALKSEIMKDPREALSSKDNDNYFQQEHQYSMASATAFFLICMLIGLPVWWTTTSVQRESLPYSDIYSAYEGVISSKVDLQFVVTQPTGKIHRHIISKFGEHIQDRFKETFKAQQQQYHHDFRGNIRLATDVERSAVSLNASLESMSKLLPTSNASTYTFYLITSDEKVPLVTLESQVLIPVNGYDLQSSAEMILDICNHLFDEDTVIEAIGATRGRPVKNSQLIKQMKSADGYTLMFTIVIPSAGNPIDIDGLFNQINSYIRDLKDKFNGLVHFNVVTQALYHNDLSPKPRRDDIGYVYSSSQFQNIINLIEARIGTSIESYPTMNFVILVPVAKYRPLNLLDDTNQRSRNNAIFIPQWGGFFVCNPADGGSNENNTLLQMQPVFSEFLPMVKLMLGTADLRGSFRLIETENGVPSQWEVDQWMRKRTVENIGGATHALVSMSNLVQKIKNMVINEQISEQVRESVEAIALSKNLLSSGKLVQAFKSSQTALKFAEDAFYDRSLLELLYFPEDQKYAIYIPLFLPVGLPLLSSVFYAFKFYRGSRKAKID